MLASRSARWLPGATLGLALAGCRAAPAPAPAPTSVTAPHTEVAVDTIAPPWTLHVADGSGNGYHLAHEIGGTPSFEYRPVTPETSSSGTYSGGPPRTGPLTDSQVASLWAQIDAVVNDTAGHAPRREKGTIAIDAAGPTQARVILTAPAGAALLASLAALPTASTAP